MTFKYHRFSGVKVNPGEFGGIEPGLDKIVELYSNNVLHVEGSDMVSIAIRRSGGKEILWLRRETYEKAKDVLAIDGESNYRAHEGVTFTASKGAWIIIGVPVSVKCPPGYGDKCYLVNTMLGRNLGLESFVVEARFVYRGFKGEDISDDGRIINYRYFLAAYNEYKPLSGDELKDTLLWRNYLSNKEVQNVIQSTSGHLKKEFWHLERMRKEAFSKYKVVWRDVARRFIAAIEDSGAIPDYTVNYISVESYERARSILIFLQREDVNSVVEELSPWIGHVQPRFIEYFKIP